MSFSYCIMYVLFQYLLTLIYLFVCLSLFLGDGQYIHRLLGSDVVFRCNLHAAIYIHTYIHISDSLLLSYNFNTLFYSFSYIYVFWSQIYIYLNLLAYVHINAGLFYFILLCFIFHYWHISHDIFLFFVTSCYISYFTDFFIHSSHYIHFTQY